MRRKSILDVDRYQVGHLTFYCLNPDCQEARWECGAHRLKTSQHFDADGLCRNRPATEKKRGT